MAARFLRAPRGGSTLTSIALVVALLTLLAPPAWPARPDFSTVVIDPGHGGFDRGGIPGQNVSEKAMALDVSLRLARKLRAAGFHVVMTRDSDVFVPLGTRVNIANRYHDAVFVCIHFNSATRANANGIETYYYSNQSAALAANIHRQVIAGTTSDNRGIRRRGYYVLRRTTIPSVLVECGFLTNPWEARMALKSDYRDRLADEIAAGIMGKSPPRNRPVVAGLTHVAPPTRQAFDFNDFVRADPERQPTHRTSRSSKKSRKSSQKKSTSSSKKTSTSKKKSSTSKAKKKKKKTDTDE